MIFFFNEAVIIGQNSRILSNLITSLFIYLFIFTTTKNHHYKAIDKGCWVVLKKWVSLSNLVINFFFPENTNLASLSLFQNLESQGFMEKNGLDLVKSQIYQSPVLQIFEKTGIWGSFEVVEQTKVILIEWFVCDNPHKCYSWYLKCTYWLLKLSIIIIIILNNKPNLYAYNVFPY